MPTFISDGKWKPALERVVLTNENQEATVYEGPDRAAMFDLKQQGVDHLGKDIRLDPEMIIRAKQMGFKDVNEYLEAAGYNEKNAKAEYTRKSLIVNTHKNPERKKPTEFMGGGFDYTGNGKNALGGFGEIPSVEEMVSKKAK